METSKCKTSYCVLWSYDDFMYEYEECGKEYDSARDCLIDLLEQKRNNKDFQKTMGEPKCSFRIRRKQEFADEPNTVYITDFNVRKYRNRYFLKRAEDII